MLSLIDLVLMFIQVYFWILMVRVLLSWIPSLQSSAIGAVVYSLTEPYVNLFRGIRLNIFAGLDLSFLWAMIFLQMVQMMFQEVARGSFVSAQTLVWFLVSSIGSVFFLLLALSLLLVIARFIVSYATTTPYSTIAFLDHWISPIMNKVRSVIAKRRVVKFRTLLLASMASLVAGLLVLNLVLGVLFKVVSLIPF